MRSRLCIVLVSALIFGSCTKHVHSPDPNIAAAESRDAKAAATHKRFGVISNTNGNAIILSASPANPVTVTLQYVARPANMQVYVDLYRLLAYQRTLMANGDHYQFNAPVLDNECFVYASSQIDNDSERPMRITFIASAGRTDTYRGDYLDANGNPQTITIIVAGM